MGGWMVGWLGGWVVDSLKYSLKFSVLNFKPTETTKLYFKPSNAQTTQWF
jgi:hypothetical protein